MTLSANEQPDRDTPAPGSGRPTIGEGVFTYEALHDWGELPPHIRYGNTHGVCEDSQGRIYVFHTVGAGSERPHAMVVFDADGKFETSWGEEFAGGAHGLHLQREGDEEFLYLCDIDRSLVVKTSLRGEVVLTLGYPHDSPSYAPPPGGATLKYRPTNVAVAPNGDIYVGDGYGSSFVNQYTRTGEFIRSFGGTGSGPGQLSCPHGLIVDTRSDPPVLMVADRRNKRIQTFTLDGQHLGFIDGTRHPCHFHRFGETMVVPDLWSRVTLLDARNDVITHLGEDDPDAWKTIREGPREAFPAGRFVCPHSACFDRAGNIFVVEWVEVGRVTKLRRIP